MRKISGSRPASYQKAKVFSDYHEIKPRMAGTSKKSKRQKVLCLLEIDGELCGTRERQGDLDDPKIDPICKEEATEFKKNCPGVRVFELKEVK